MAIRPIHITLRYHIPTRGSYRAYCHTPIQADNLFRQLLMPHAGRNLGTKCEASVGSMTKKTYICKRGYFMPAKEANLRETYNLFGYERHQGRIQGRTHAIASAGHSQQIQRTAFGEPFVCAKNRLFPTGEASLRAKAAGHRLLHAHLLRVGEGAL